MVTCGLRLIVSGSSTPSLMTALVLPHLGTEEDAFEADGGLGGTTHQHIPAHVHMVDHCHVLMYYLCLINQITSGSQPSHITSVLWCHDQ